MNEKTINEQYAYIRTLLEEKRLKEALMQLESLLWQRPDWDLFCGNALTCVYIPDFNSCKLHISICSII